VAGPGVPNPTPARTYPLVRLNLPPGGTLPEQDWSMLSPQSPRGAADNSGRSGHRRLMQPQVARSLTPDLRRKTDQVKFESPARLPGALQTLGRKAVGYRGRASPTERVGSRRRRHVRTIVIPAGRATHVPQAGHERFQRTVTVTSRRPVGRAHLPDLRWGRPKLHGMQVVAARIGLAVPSRPIGPWSRRTGARRRPRSVRDRNLVRLWSVGPGVTKDNRGPPRTLIAQVMDRLASSTDRRSVATTTRSCDRAVRCLL
jgi:hypothetical protein